MNFKTNQQVLDNQLPVVKLAMPQLKSATVLLIVGAGSRNEDQERAGIAHFLEHLVFKGTDRYPTALKLASRVDGIGAEFNAFTSKEYTGFYVKAAVEHLETALEVLSQLVWHPLLPKQELEREKGVIVEEINMRNDTPMLKVGEEFETLLYGQTALGRPTIGTKKTVKKMKKKDFIAYRQQWYRPENMVLAVGGGLEAHQPKALDQLINQYFKVDQKRSKPPAKTEKVDSQQQKPELRISDQQTEQAHLCLGVRTFKRGHQDRYVLSVLATILGGNMSSRLFTQVRERRGLAYYIKTDLSSYFDHGYLVAQAGVDLKKTEEAIKVILEEYRRIAKDVQQKELTKAKEYLKGKLALALEDSREVVSLLAKDLVLEGRIRTPKEIVKGVEAVSLADLQRVAKKIFVNQGLNLAVVGRFKPPSGFAKIFKL